MPNISIQEARPPYVTFEERAIEDREATLKAGHMVMKSQYWAFIYPQGSKDCTEREVEEWLSSLRQRAEHGHIPRAWVDKYTGDYERFRSGQEEVPDGTHVKDWPSITKANVMNLVNARVLTVEDCAAMNEQTMQRVGMGSRELKQKAIDWLASGNKRKSAAEMEKLRAENTNMTTRLQSLEEQNRVLAAKLEVMLARQPKEEI